MISLIFDFIGVKQHSLTVCSDCLDCFWILICLIETCTYRGLCFARRKGGKHYIKNRCFQNLKIWCKADFSLDVDIIPDFLGS